MDITTAFPAETDLATAELFEQQQREMNKFQTRYVYLPFYEGICQQIPRGFVPAGVIHPIPAPKGKVNVKLLPEGAQVLMVVSPSVGVPRPGAKIQHKDPEIAELLRQIEQLRQMATDRGNDPPNIAIYLHEVKPIVDGVTSVYGREGAVEIRALFGMPENAFEKHNMNDLIFGVESERAATAQAILERMDRVIKQAGSQKGEAPKILMNVATEIAESVRRCERFCEEHVRQRHLEMEDSSSDAPKRYSKRDLRALDFIGGVRREEYLQRVAAQQQQAQVAIPRMLEAMERREQQWADMFAEMTNVLKSISASAGQTKKGN